jgi:Ca2+-binding RTX toxin-like protein
VEVARRRRDSKGRLGAFAVAGAAALLAFPAVANADVSSDVDAQGVLTVQTTAGDAVTITSDAGNVKINGDNPDDGQAASADINAIRVIGDDAANDINLAGVATPAFDPLLTVLVEGKGGNDLINGSQLADTLKGGDGHDRVIGDDSLAGSLDDMRGEAGDDTLVWNPGDDDDINEGGEGYDTAEVNGGGKERFDVNPSGGGRVLFERVQDDPTFGAPFKVDISDDTERLDLNAGGAEDIVNAGAGLFDLQLAVDIDGGDGNDVLDGSDGPDLMTGGAGNDRIIGDDNPANTFDDMRGGDGDDTMVWNGGDDDDINEGGAGNDTSEVNGGGKELFRVNPSANPGRVLFERVQQDPSFLAAFKVDISDDTERLDLNADAGEDIVEAGAGLAALAFALDIAGGDANDVIDGSDGADLIDAGAGDDRIAADDNPANTLDDVRGGPGDDTMTWNPADDDDINEGGEGNDTVVVNGGGKERFEVTPSATPGRVAFNRRQPNQTFLAPFSIDIATSENLVLNAGDGNDEIKGSSGLAGLIDSTFNGDDGKDQIKGTDGEDLLSGGKGSDLIRSFDHAADQVECDSGFDLALVDRRDTVRACEIVLGGALKVKVVGKSVDVSGGVAAITLLCVATKKCSGLIKLRHGGKTIASSKFAMGKKKSKTVRLKLNKRGLGLLVKAPKKGVKVQLRIDAKDAARNGWRTDSRLQLTR